MRIFASICAILILLILAMISTEVEGWVWPYSRGRLTTVTPVYFDKAGPAFHKVPTSKYDPLFKDYQKEYTTDFCHPFALYCFPNDPSYCLITYLSYVVGIQIGYLAKYAHKVPPEVFDYANNTNFVVTKTCNQTIYSVRIWFSNPEKLAEYGRTDMSEMIDGIWVYLNGKLVRIDQRCQSVGPTIGCLDLQGCIPMKGTLYVYDFNKHSCCRNPFYIFLVYARNSMVGFGHATVGYFPPGPHRDWFNRPKGSKLAQIAPSPPSCFAEFIHYGITSSITFLIDDPHNIKCPVCGC